jgi:hypothetical protein
VMLARIGPVKPFLFKALIAHSEACGRAEDEPPTRSSHALPQRRTRRQRARSARTSRQGDCTGGGAAYREASLVSAVMLARIGPVKPFPARYLIAPSGGMRPHGTSCKRAAAALARGMRRVGGEPGRAKGAHRRVSAVSAEIVGGTLPTRPG